MKTTLTTLAVLLLSALLLAQANPAAATPSAAPAKPPSAADFPNGFESNHSLVAGGDNPILGFNVAHAHLMDHCSGLLFISRDSIRYVVLQPPGSDHSFQYSRAEMTTARPWQPLIPVSAALTHATELKFRGRTYHFYMLRPGGMMSSGWGDFVPSSQIIETINGFDAAVARLAPKPPPAPTPPAITLVEPAGAEESKPVEAGATLRVRGIATQPSGIALVTVNGQPATLKVLSPQTAEFLLPTLAVAPGTTSVLVLATATDKAEAHLVFSVMRPEVKVTAPAPGAQSSDATVAVRGVATGFRELDRVEVAGQRATLTRQPDGSVQFEIAALPVPVGDSTLQGSAISTSGHAETFSVAVKRLPPAGPPALGLKEVLDALENRVPKPRLLALIDQYGVDFALNDDIERQLREAGADSDLLLAIAKAKR